MPTVTPRAPAQCPHQAVRTCTTDAAAPFVLADARRPGRSAPTNSIAPVVGMVAGVLASTLLIRCAPAPTVTVYVVPAVLFAALPAVAAGVATQHYGLRTAAHAYAVAPALLAVAAVAALAVSSGRAAHSAHDDDLP